MLTDDIIEMFAEQWLGAVDGAAPDADFICYCGRSLDAPGYERQSNIIYDLVTTETLDALVVWTSTLGIHVGRERMAQFARRFGTLPVVSVEQPLGTAPTVLMDNRGGMRAAVEHLITVHGRRRVAFVRGPATHDGAEQRYQGYLDALTRHGLPVNPELISDPLSSWQPEEAALATTRILGGTFAPDAIAAANDDLAMAVLSMLRMAGVPSPEQVSVVGFDDSTNVRTHDLGFDSGTADEGDAVRRTVNISAETLSLTTVRAPFRELGRRAVAAAIRLARGDPVPASTTIGTELIVRRSCGCLPAVARALPQSAPLPGDRLERLFTAYAAEAAGRTRGEFQRLLSDLVRDSLRAGEGVEVWWQLLETLRGITGAGTDALWVDAQMLLHETAQRHWRYAYVLAEKRNQIVREVGQALITAPDVAGLADTLCAELPKLGIPGCYLAAYLGDDPATARLLLAYERGRRIGTDEAGDVFRSVRLAPGDRVARLSPYSLVVVPLYFKEQQLGFATFQLGPRIGWIYPALQDQLSSALHRALMVEREQRTLSALREEVRQRQEAEAALQTAHAELEQRVRDRTAELARANAVLTEQISQLERAERLREALEAQLRQAQKMEAMGRLAGGIAHDFNNLLVVINGNGDALLRRLVPDDPLRDELEEIVAAGEKAANLTRQLLTFSRRQVHHPGVVDLNQVIGNVQPILRRLIGEDIQLTTRLKPNLDAVFVDVGQIEQVLFNLAVNARDAMPDGGVLSMETDTVVVDDESARERLDVEPGRYVVVRVRDTGVGMDDLVRTRLFEPFFTTKAADKGTGLGLAMVFGILRQSGGHIGVRSAPGAGTTFEIHLPAVAASPDAVPDPGPTRVALRGRETILLVEDNPEVRRATRRFLDAYGYRVIEAVDGAEALRASRAHEGPVDLVITDVVMPRMGGRELVDHLAQLRPTTPVLYISGYADSSTVDTIAAPAVGLLYKPFTAEALVGRVREILDRRPPRPAR